MAAPAICQTCVLQLWQVAAAEAMHGGTVKLPYTCALAVAGGCRRGYTWPCCLLRGGSLKAVRAVLLTLHDHPYRLGCFLSPGRLFCPPAASELEGCPSPVFWGIPVALLAGWPPPPTGAA